MYHNLDSILFSMYSDFVVCDRTINKDKKTMSTLDYLGNWMLWVF